MPNAKPTTKPRTKPATPEGYLAALPADRREAVGRLRGVLLERLPKGFSETMAYGMLAYVVPHATYPAGYHCDPKQPLPFISLANQKGYVALYHMGLYADPKLLAWFTAEYPKHEAGKLDMGKSCIRFKKPDRIPFGLLGDLAGKLTPKQWIALYERELKR